MPAAADSKVLMIGLDSPNLDHVRGSLHRLPHLRGLFEHGTWCDLASSADCLDASPWPTFYSGRLPGEHGVYHPMQWDAAAMRHRRLSADWFYSEPFWYALARQGVPVIAADVPMVLSGAMPSGIEVRNWSTQENTGPLETSPPELVREILGRVGDYPQGRDVPIDHTAGQRASMHRMLLRIVPLRTQLWLWLLQQAPWRFAITVFAECHRAEHNLSPGPLVDGPGQALLEVYEAIDQSIGEMLAAVDQRRTTVIVFSAHSMGPNTSQSHLLQRIMDRVNATFWQSLGRQGDGPRRSVLRRLRENIPPAVQLAITRSTPDAFRDWVVDRAQRTGLDWTTTPALAVVCGQTGLIRLNVAGRERDGLLDRESELYARYVAWLRQSLLELRANGSGAPLVASVENVPGCFPGPRAELLPDFAVRWTDLPPVMEARSDRLGTIRARFGTGRPGNHRSPAFAIVAAPESQAPAFRGLTHTTDLAASVLRSFAVHA